MRKLGLSPLGIERTIMNKHNQDSDVFCPRLTKVAKKCNIDIQSLKDDLGSPQCLTLEYWLGCNDIDNIEIEKSGIIAKISGVVVIEGTKICEISTEVVMWDMARRSYSRDYAQFLQNKARGDTRGGDKE